MTKRTAPAAPAAPTTADEFAAAYLAARVEAEQATGDARLAAERRADEIDDAAYELGFSIPVGALIEQARQQVHGAPAADWWK